MIFLYFEKNICKLFSSYVILRRLFTTYKLIIHRSIFLVNRVSVCSPTVRIIAFQAIDPGSTPGKRIFFVSSLDSAHFSRFLCFGLLVRMLPRPSGLAHVNHQQAQHKPMEGSCCVTRVGHLLLMEAS